MTRTCMFGLHGGCDRDADTEIVLVDTEDDFDPMRRYVCDRHIGWYRQEFVKERDYEMKELEVG